MSKQCEYEWNPGVWPYASRCALEENHDGEHVDRHNRIAPTLTDTTGEK